jgi:hypothetical protein
MLISELRKDLKEYAKQETAKDIKHFREAILSYSGQKEQNIENYIINYDGNLNFIYLHLLQKEARKATLNMINSLEKKQKINSSERQSLINMVDNCCEGHDMRAIVQGENMQTG